MRTSVIVILTFVLASFAVSATADIALEKSPIEQAFYSSLHGDEFSTDNDIHPGESEASSSGRKSVVKAAVLSALIPGAGEFYLGNKKKARYFFAAEALTWVGFAAFRVYSSWKEDDFIRFAAVHANARLEDKDDEFRDLVGFYSDINQYNSFGRVFDPERPYLEDTPDNHWRWDSIESRGTYRHLKNRSREAKRRSEFMIGIAVVSRIISVIDTIRDGKRQNRELDSDGFSDRSGPDLKFEVDPFSRTKQVSLTLFTDFR